MNNTIHPGVPTTLGVIIPVYNRRHLALGAIQSVLAQSGAHVTEIIVVDDGSTDGGADFLREACRKFHVPVRIFSIPNGGAANARSYGMRQCNCDLYAFLDSDDAWLPEKLARQLPLFEDPEVGMVGCLTTMDGRRPSPQGTAGQVRRISLRSQLFKNSFATPSVIVRRQVVAEVGAFPHDQRHAEEGDFYFRIASRYRCLLLTEVLVDCDNGKPGFGASGLSANLVAMELGELRNFQRVYRRGDCSFGLYVVASVYSLAKFVRRVLVSFVRRQRTAT